MKHKHITELLLLYLDGELSGRAAEDVEMHLQQCAACREHLATLAEVWQSDSDGGPAQPSPFLWTRVQAGLRDLERSGNGFADLVAQLIRISRPALAVATLLGGIFLGVYLGRIPAAVDGQTYALQTSEQEREQFLDSIYLDSFADLPPESVGGAYLSVATTEPGESR